MISVAGAVIQAIIEGLVHVGLPLSYEFLIVLQVLEPRLLQPNGTWSIPNQMIEVTLPELKLAGMSIGDHPVMIVLMNVRCFLESFQPLGSSQL